MKLLDYLLIVGPLLGYLLGSIPFGLIIGLAKGVDIRKVGSGNIGATNLGRATRGCDTSGMRSSSMPSRGCCQRWRSASLLTWRGCLHGWRWLPVSLRFAGHIFPIYLKFKGGKGVATSFGAVLGVWPIFTLAGVAAGTIFLVVFMAYRYISLASIVSSICFVPFVLILGLYFQQPWHSLGVLLVAVALLACLIVVKHRASNIGRLLAGTEPKYTQSNRLAAHPPG